jgi:hypothetical protein
LGSELTTKGAIKSYDVLTNERISTRKHGWLVRAGVAAITTTLDDGDKCVCIELKKCSKSYIL